ncbi:MAG: DUF4435 domain-containing protein [Altererythrobacter sp.]
MTFERTAAGQANRAIFYDSDFICFVEGVDQKETGDDIFFWHIVFSSLAPNSRAKFLSRGGKPELESLARATVANDTDNVFVAMDADYSRFFEGRMFFHSRIFYTYGYSWENDVFSPGVDESLYLDVARSTAIPDEAKVKHRASWDRLRKPFQLMMAADFHAFRCGGSVVDAQKPGQILAKAADGGPEFRRNVALSLVMAANTERKSKSPRACIERPTDEMRYSKGRLLSYATRLITGCSASEFANAKQPSEAHLKAISFVVFRERLRFATDDPIVDHHRAQVARVAA